MYWNWIFKIISNFNLFIRFRLTTKNKIKIKSYTSALEYTCLTYLKIQDRQYDINIILVYYSTENKKKNESDENL